MRYDVWWRAEGNNHWHLVPGVLAWNMMDAAQYVLDKSDVPDGSRIIVYEREKFESFKTHGGYMRSIR